MSRKSVAALSVVAASPVHRLEPPRDLSADELALWSEVIESKPADWFDSDSVPVLKEYVRAAVTCNRLSVMVDHMFAAGEPKDIKDALDMRDKESRRCANLATKLRLTQQSRYTPQAASTANRKAGGPRPWQSGG